MKNNLTILYVEDEKGVQDNLSKFLKHFSSELYLASNGKDGLELYKQYNPDIVISDIQMPIMDGIEMTKAIKQINMDQYVIFTTAFNDNDFFIEAIELQVEGYILKPIDLDKLEEKIIHLYKQIEAKKDLQVKKNMLIQQSKLASMGEMIGNIAHQWRQPLSIISTAASGALIEKEYGTFTDEKFKSEMNMIVKSCNYLSETIDDFRNFFKNGKGSIKANLKEFIEKSLNLTTPAFKDNFIKVIQDIDLEINVYGDKNQLSQVIINILNNAKDALKSINNIQDKMLLISTKKINNDYITITIQDNAGGIPEDIKDKIFEPYFTTKHQSQGTGLGLYIAHQIIVENLSGSMVAQNEEYEYEGKKYKGAKFILTLPIYKEISIK